MGTGNPASGLRWRSTGRVYPRGHGESLDARGEVEAASGLSPWARGIRTTAARERHRTGSIPVGTGNPFQNGLAAGVLRVYPRGHGESVKLAATAAVAAGLSPWARGIQLLKADAPEGQRSIPVGTGNPGYYRQQEARLGVYPRGHGESSDRTRR